MTTTHPIPEGTREWTIDTDATATYKVRLPLHRSAEDARAALDAHMNGGAHEYPWAEEIDSPVEESAHVALSCVAPKRTGRAVISADPDVDFAPSAEDGCLIDPEYDGRRLADALRRYDSAASDHARLAAAEVLAEALRVSMVAEQAAAGLTTAGDWAQALTEDADAFHNAGDGGDAEHEAACELAATARAAAEALEALPDRYLAAANAAVDLITDRFDLDSNAEDLLNLHVNAMAVLVDRPEATLPEVITESYQPIENAESFLEDFMH
ncbi:hypothetical protein [Nocardia sp. NPDC050435]|uniref:hypothetical protein n=1 Tax=Nocardia sp. NPDC050435 TaxID=3155040 RepID=UPI0033E0FB26